MPKASRARRRLPSLTRNACTCRRQCLQTPCGPSGRAPGRWRARSGSCGKRIPAPLARTAGRISGQRHDQPPPSSPTEQEVADRAGHHISVPAGRSQAHRRGIRCCVFAGSSPRARSAESLVASHPRQVSPRGHDGSRARSRGRTGRPPSGPRRVAGARRNVRLPAVRRPGVRASRRYLPWFESAGSSCA